MALTKFFFYFNFNFFVYLFLVDTFLASYYCHVASYAVHFQIHIYRASSRLSYPTETLILFFCSCILPALALLPVYVSVSERRIFYANMPSL